MKRYVALYVLISAPLYADNFSAPDSPPTVTNSLELQHYVKTIKNYQPETKALRARLEKTIDYYKKVHILKTVRKPNYTVDCIPFTEQPGLIDNPQQAKALLKSVKKTTQANLEALTLMGENFDFNAASQCPIGSVAILRPSQTILNSKIANQKVAPNTLHGGYSYQLGVDSPNDFVSIQTQANQAYFKGPQHQFVVANNFSDHSLDQFWFTNNTYQQAIPTYSVEFGILASAYFTTPASTSIFVFASVDNYGNNSCYNLECPNFVQFPNTPVLGNPVNTQIDYIFQAAHTTLNQYLITPAYYLTLATHNPSKASANVLLGYYADSLYPSSSDLPQYFSAGAEVYAVRPLNGTLMYGNYMTPYVGYPNPSALHIEFTTENGNSFPYYAANGPSPYGVIWHLGQKKP